jgi:hypothetical protein
LRIRIYRLKQPEKDIVNDPLHRWLVYFDKNSPINLIEEVLSMDPAIQEMQKKIDWINGDPELLRSYLRYEKATSDEITRINGTKREIARNALAEGATEEFVSKITGLDMDTIKRLKIEL